MAVGKFRSNVWDPVLIISQIIAVQTTFYFFLCAWYLLLNTLSQRPLLLNQLFTPSEVSFNSGRLLICVFALNSLSSALALWFIVQRAKQCLDFTCTAHFFHLLACWGVCGAFPTAWVWWVLTGVTVAFTALLSEYLCMRYEMKAIPVNHT